jgi:hypothetical protein
MGGGKKIEKEGGCLFKVFVPLLHYVFLDSFYHHFVYATKPWQTKWFENVIFILVQKVAMV